jgi:putative phosphoesterase
VIAVLSDAHGNIEALKRGFEVAEKHGATQYVFLGDSIGYLPSLEALELLRTIDIDIICIRGNHEDMYLKNSVETSKDEIILHSVIREQMTEVQLQFIRDMKECHKIQIDGIEAIFVHGTLDDPINGYLYPDSKFLSASEGSAKKIVFMGNTHVPFMRKEEDTILVNAGSVGLPRDHGTVASLALFDSMNRKVRIVRYDVNDIQVKVAAKFESIIHSSVTKAFDRVSPYRIEEELSFD